MDDGNSVVEPCGGGTYRGGGSRCRVAPGASTVATDDADAIDAASVLLGELRDTYDAYCRDSQARAAPPAVG